MALLLVIALSTWKATPITASCPEKEEPSFCQSNALIPQLYCPGVDLQDKWQCKKRSDGRCACKASLFRRLDGKCVPESECGPDQTIWPPSAVDAGASKGQDQSVANPSTGEAGDDQGGKTEEVEDKRGEPRPQKAQEAFHKLLMVLQYSGPLHLQMMTEDEWVKFDCECVQSRFYASYNEGSERTLECYKYVKQIKASATSGDIRKEVMIKIKEVVQFQAVTEDAETRIQLKNIIEVTPTNDPPRYFPQTYTVLQVEPDCLLLSSGVSKNHTCLLWGLSRRQVNADTECLKRLQSVCTQDMYDLTEFNGPCQQLDREETRLDQIMKEAETAEPASD
ncbi:uncharacterized protein LOC142591027 isoform X2 [Dermacentor variabilis]|uniref:uncharacterized protein LOC142591027 isoform X2 n=1 Tax=Dermacentor variabilis TaxID=34621 RepID=UPI003F5BA0A3